MYICMYKIIIHVCMCDVYILIIKNNIITTYNRLNTCKPSSQFSFSIDQFGNNLALCSPNIFVLHDSFGNYLNKIPIDSTRFFRSDLEGRLIGFSSKIDIYF